MGFKKDDSSGIPKSSFSLSLVFLPRVYFLGYSSYEPGLLFKELTFPLIFPLLITIRAIYLY